MTRTSGDFGISSWDLKGIYQHLEHFRSLMESGVIPLPGIVTTPEGEEIYLADMMAGIDDLPPRQREAFGMICLQGYTETAATRVMLPNSKWSTPVQQYADTALARMVAKYDAVQAGALAALTQEEAKRRKAPPKKRKVSMSPSPTKSTRNLQAALEALQQQRDGLEGEISTAREALTILRKSLRELEAEIAVLQASIHSERR